MSWTRYWTIKKRFVGLILAPFLATPGAHEEYAAKVISVCFVGFLSHLFTESRFALLQARGPPTLAEYFRIYLADPMNRACSFYPRTLNSFTIFTRGSSESLLIVTPGTSTV